MPVPGPDHLVSRAQAGDVEARESLIRDFLPFVLRVVSRTRGQYVTRSSEEASIGLMAFNEAIDSYQPRHGTGFLSFCETVIRRRLIDQYRREAQHQAREIPLSELEEEDEEGGRYAPVEVQAAWAAHQAYVENWERREEVGRFKEGLRGLGLALPDLVRVCPRHRDARKRALAVAQYLAQHPELGREALARREIPVRELQAQLNVGRKALERNRKYILAMTLVLMGDYPYLQDYLRS